MIRRFLCLLIVFAMLANQGLCFAHVHHESECAEPGGHGVRPHFHVGGNAHHEPPHHHDQADPSHPHNFDNVPDSGHRGATCPPATTTANDHDSDTVYCAEWIAIASLGNSGTGLPDKDFDGPASLHLAIQDDGSQPLGPRRCQPPAIFEPACPIYLRTLSLRI